MYASEWAIDALKITNLLIIFSKKNYKKEHDQSKCHVKTKFSAMSKEVMTFL